MTTQLFVVTLNNNNNGSSLQRKHLQTPQQNDKLETSTQLQEFHWQSMRKF